LCVTVCAASQQVLLCVLSVTLDLWETALQTHEMVKIVSVTVPWWVYRHEGTRL